MNLEKLIAFYEGCLSAYRAADPDKYAWDIKRLEATLMHLRKALPHERAG